MRFRGKSETSQQVCAIGRKNSLMKQNYRTKEEVYLSLWRVRSSFLEETFVLRPEKPRSQLDRAEPQREVWGFLGRKENRSKNSGAQERRWASGRREPILEESLWEKESQQNLRAWRQWAHVQREDCTREEQRAHVAVRDEDACTETVQGTGERPGPWHTRDTGSGRLEEQLGLGARGGAGRSQRGRQLSFAVRAGVLHSHCNPLPANFWRGRLVQSLTEEGRGEVGREKMERSVGRHYRSGSHKTPMWIQSADRYILLKLGSVCIC